MQRRPITICLPDFPEVFHPFLAGTAVFDSSCSPEAWVWYLDREGGMYLKTAPAGSLKQEAEMTAFFHSKGLSAQVLRYVSAERDWLLTRAIPGEDCTHEVYLANPERLCDTLAGLLRRLHEENTAGCPVTDQNLRRFRAAKAGRITKPWENDLFAGVWEFASEEEAWQAAEEGFPLLKNEVLLHGDYCLPNILLDNWAFSGFIDVGGGGVGDRHIDLLWGTWTLMFNLKTNRYFDRFLDAYGRDAVNKDILCCLAAIETFG